MLKIIDYTILASYLVGMIVITIYTKNRAKSVKDFLLAGKSGLNGWMSAFSYGTTYFSAVIFIGYAGKFGAQYQLGASWIGIGNAILGALIPWLILAKRTKTMTTNLQAKTMPEFFEKRYDSKNLKIVSAIVIFVFLIPYSASVYNGLSSLFEMVFSIPGWVVMLVLASVTALYLFVGGYFATALSDFIQGIIMLVGVVMMVMFFLGSEQVSWNLEGLNWFTFGSPNKGLYGDTVSLLSLILLTSFGVWALPQTIHKYYTVRNDLAIKQGTIVSTVFALIIGFGAYFVGGLSSRFSLSGVHSDQIVPSMLASGIIPVGLLGIIAVLILSASMSTLSSVSLASASVVAVDLYKGKINPQASDKKVTTIMRVLCLVFIVVSLVLALLNEKFKLSAIAYLMGISWGTLAGCFMGPYVLGVVWKRVTRPAVWASIISSLALTVTLIFILGYFSPSYTGGIGSMIKQGVACSPLIGVICMASSLILTAAVSLLTKPIDGETVNKAFNKEIAE